MAPELEDALIVVPRAELHEVENGAQRLRCVGDFSISLVGAEGDAAQAVRAQVGGVSWNLGKHLPALKAAPTIYSFGLEHTRQVYYCLILPQDTPAAVLEAVQDVLVSSCAFSTVRQLDAADAEADQLAGGKEARKAAALAAQQQAAAGGGGGGGAAAAAAAGGVPAAVAAAAGGPAAPSASAYPVHPVTVAPAAAAASAYPTPPVTAAPAAPASAYPTHPVKPTAPASAYPMLPAAAGPTVPAASGAGAQQQRQQQQPQPQPRPPTTADRVASGIVVGGAMVADIVKKGSGMLTGAICAYKEKHLANPPPPQQPGAPAARVSPHFRRGLKVAAAVASGAAYVTGKLAALVGDATYALALRIAKALPGHDPPRPGNGAGSVVGGADLAPEERSAFKTVGAAGLAAYVEVYDALEDAAKQVLSHSAEASAQYIHYKYGPEAGAAAAESVPVAQDMIQAAINFTRLGARAMISRTAKRTAKIYLKSTVAGQHPDDQVPHRRAGSPAVARPAAAAAPAVARTS